MIKYNEIKITWTSGACPPDGLYMDRVYSILKKDDELFISDGNAEIKIDEFMLKTFFTPKNNIHWDKIDFSEESTPKKK